MPLMVELHKVCPWSVSCGNYHPQKDPVLCHCVTAPPHSQGMGDED